MALALTQRRGLILGSVFVAALLAGLLLSFGWEHVKYRDRVARGMTCAHRDVSGLEREELERLLKTLASRTSKQTLELRLDDQRQTRTLGALGARLDVEETSQRLLRAGRDRGITRSLLFWSARLFSKIELEPVVLVDSELLHKQVQPWAEKVLPQPALPKISYQKELIVEPGAAGESVDYGKLESELAALFVSRLNGQTRQSSTTLSLRLVSRPQNSLIGEHEFRESVAKAEALLSAPVTLTTEGGSHRIKIRTSTLGELLGSYVDGNLEKLVLTLSVAQLRPKMKSFLADIEKPAKDAQFVFGAGATPRIVESEAGLVVDEKALADAIWAASRTNERTAIITLRQVEPKLTTLVASSLGVKGIVSQFVTHHPCCQPRVDNIHTAADRLDGTILKPGERFSLNDLLGPRTPASGYKSAPTIVRGEMRDVYGGGISQLATTLFNAVLRGGYKIIQRQPHSVYFPRYPEGHEATVSYPLPDLIFENDTQAGMLIRAEYTGTYIKVLIYGDDGGRIVSVSKSARYNIVEPDIEYEANEEADPEKPKRLRAGQLGWTVLVSRKVKYPDGHVDEEKREVVYQSRPELQRVHPCVIPEGEDGYTGEPCPEPEEHEEELSEDVFYETAPVYDEEEG